MSRTVASFLVLSIGWDMCWVLEQPLVHIDTGVIVSYGLFQCLFLLVGYFGFFIRTQLSSDTGTEISVEYRPANRGKMLIDSA